MKPELKNSETGVPPVTIVRKTGVPPVRSRRVAVLTTVVLAVAALIVLAIVRSSRRPDSKPDVATVPLFTSPEEQPEGTLQETADGEAVFKQAFWRRPGVDDRIVHAERREWSDHEGVSRWQWFLEVEPSPDLKNWLQQDNPFSLVRSGTPQLQAGAAAAPSWFPKSARGLEIHQSGDGEMSLLFSEERDVLYATGSGHGFAKGATATEKPVVKIETIGRLPLTPPPHPISQP